MAKTFNLRKGVLEGLTSQSPSAPSDSSTPIVDAETPASILLEKIYPWEDQPRQYYSEASVDQLAASFRKHGFKGTLVVRPHPSIEGRYQLVAGERRYRAAQRAELLEVLVFVGSFTDEEALDFSLGENLHREDLTKLEETLGILRLIEARHSIAQGVSIELVKTEGHNYESGSNVTPSEDLQKIIDVLHEFGIELQTFRTAHLATLKLPEDLRQAHLEKGLSYLSAKALNQIKDANMRELLLSEVIEEGLSVRDVRERVKTVLADGVAQAPVKKKEKAGAEFSELKSLATQLAQQKKTILADPAKMKKIKRILVQLKDLVEPVET